MPRSILRPLIQTRACHATRRLIGGTSKLLQSLSPPRCLLCKENHDRPHAICANCEGLLPRNSRACCQCGLPLGAAVPAGARQIEPSEHCGACRRGPPRFQHTLAPFLMQAGMQELIHLWKFQGQSHLTSLLAVLFTSAIAPRTVRQIPRSAVLVPIPTQWHRQIVRGFDHTWLLAQALRWHLPGDNKINPWLRNTGFLKPQHRLDRRDRMKRGRDRFSAHPNAAGEHIILIDDVMTTGATARSAAAAFAAVGAQSITMWCLARTPAPEDKRTDTLR